MDPAKLVGRVKSKLSFYYLLKRRQHWFLPSPTCSLVTMDYLVAVRCGEIDCLKYEDVRLAPCPIPPRKDILLRELLAAAKK